MGLAHDEDQAGRTDEPRPLSQYLGCRHRVKEMSRSKFDDHIEWVNDIARRLSIAEVLIEANVAGVRSKSETRRGSTGPQDGLYPSHRRKPSW